MNIGKYSHVTPPLYDLHWLPVRARIHFKILVLTFKAIHRLAPPYISDLISVRSNSSYNLRSNGSLLLEPPKRENARYAWRQILLCHCTMFVE